MTDDTPASFIMQGHGNPVQLALVAQRDAEVRAMALVVTQRMVQQSLEQEVTEQFGAPRSRRSTRPVAWVCRHCQTRQQCRFRRNGHYRRCLTVREGTIMLAMPLVKCVCGGYADIAWQTIDRRVRYWLDIALDSVRSYLTGVSHRLVADATGAQAQVSISHLYSWRTLQTVGEEAGHERLDLGVCPRSVILDEIYIHVAGREFVFLLAVADDGRVLALEGPTTRTVEHWQRVLEKLTEHGISPVAGLVGVVADGDSAISSAVDVVWPRVVMQQCVWHILRGVASAVAAEKGRGAPEVHEVVMEAGRIFLHDACGPAAMALAKERHDAFLAKHQGSAWAEIVRRAFHEGTEYLRTPGLARTNGGAERTVREFRRRSKTMDGFKSEDGGHNFALIWRVWQNLRRERAQERARQVRHRRHQVNLTVC
jgi:transposase-like protein